jgi:predicted DNA-binding transcriptional regulator AlpA
MKKHGHVGVPEIAAMLGKSRQWVHTLATGDDSFPQPASVLASGKVWHTADIESWIAARQKAES